MFKVLGDRIAIKPDEAETKTKSGIYIPETSKEKPQQGTVVKVGRGTVLDNGTILEPEVKVDDKVVYTRYSGQEVKFNEETLIIVKESDIICTL